MYLHTGHWYTILQQIYSSSFLGFSNETFILSGEIAYKYKDTLISCFLNGSQHANNEFRMSNISNLGAILRLLSYQIHQNFQEVIPVFVYLNSTSTIKILFIPFR